MNGYKPHMFQYVTYMMFNRDGEVIYVGKTRNWNQRLSAHRKAPWWGEVYRIQVRPRKDEADAWVLEALLYRRHRPKYNIEGSRRVGQESTRRGVPLDISDLVII